MNWSFVCLHSEAIIVNLKNEKTVYDISSRMFKWNLVTWFDSFYIEIKIESLPNAHFVHKSIYVYSMQRAIIELVESTNGV